MKIYLPILLILLSIGSVLSQNSELRYDRHISYEDKIDSYRIMERVGTHLAIGGGIASVAGIYLLSESNWGDDSGTQATNDVSGVAGVILLTKGVPVAIMGLVFRTVAIHSLRKYERKLERISLGPALHPKAAGLSLTFNF